MVCQLNFLQFVPLGKNGFPRPGKCLVNFCAADHALLTDILFAEKVCQINCLEIKKKSIENASFSMLFRVAYATLEPVTS